MYYLVVFENGAGIVTENEPDTFVNSHVRTTQAHDTLYSCQLALNAYRLGREIGAAYTSESESVLKAEVDEYKSINKCLVETIDKLHENHADERNCINKLRQVLRRVMVSLSLQNILENTHRDRNKQNAEIIRDIHFWLNLPINHFGNDTIGLNDTDDIPF